MNSYRRIIAPFLASLLAIAVLTGPVGAQLDNSPQALNAAATAEMEKGNWKAALEPLNKCIKAHDSNALQLWGPQFGITWYRKGFCELKLKQWEAAMESFKVCYEKYPAKSEGQEGSNVFNKQALLRWGEAAQGAGQYQKAIDLYAKYLKERDPERDKFQPGTFYIQLAVCHLKLGQLEKGIEHFETALKNKVRYRTPEAGIVAAFQTLVEAAIKAKKEDVLLSFLNRNRAAVTVEPWKMENYGSLYLSLAGQAYNAELVRAAFAIYQLVPATVVMIQDAEAYLAKLGGRAGIKVGEETYSADQIKAANEALEKTVRAGNPPEVVQLAANAFLHETYGNVRGAYACYKELEEKFPNSPKREAYLFNYVRTSSILGKVLETERMGSRFLETFPASEHVPAVQRMMLTSLFYSGEYEDAILVATELLPSLKEGSAEHDMAVHVLGGSYYYTGRYTEAEPLLDQHVELYPKSKFRQAALYFQASNFVRLQYWSKAAKLLDKFLEEFPDPRENIYLPFALFDRANAHYALDENPPALEKLTRITSEFQASPVAQMAFNLKGNIEQSSGDLAAAEESYRKALELAERRDDDMVAGESLFALIALMSDASFKGERLAESIPIIDKFWKEYGESSPYKVRVAVAQLPALNSAGRGEEGLKTLQGVISEMANTPGAAGLEEAINSYTEAYREAHSVEELKDHFYKFPGVPSSAKAARALLRIALIGVFEQQAKDAGEDLQMKLKAEAGIKVLFADLRQEFDLKDLSNFILVRVGDFIRETSSYREALPYYQEALSRDDQSYLFPALFGRAAILSRGSAEDKKKAVVDFQRIVKEAQDRPDKDRAMYQMITTQMSLGDYESAIESARLYLDREKGYSSKKPEVGFMLAEAYQKAGKREDALVNYINVANSYKGLIRISAPALKRYMELLWDRNKEATDKTAADRQYAYNQGRDYTDQTRRLLDQMTEEEVEMWKEVEALVDRYVADPEVKSKEELAQENQ